MISNNTVIDEPILDPPAGKLNTNNIEEEARTGPEAIEIEVEGSDDDDYEEEEEEVEEGFKTPSPKKQQAASKSTPRMPTKKTVPPKKVVSIDELTNNSMVPSSKGFLKWQVPD